MANPKSNESIQRVGRAIYSVLVHPMWAKTIGLFKQYNSLHKGNKKNIPFSLTNFWTPLRNNKKLLLGLEKGSNSKLKHDRCKIWFFLVTVAHNDCLKFFLLVRPEKKFTIFYLFASRSNYKQIVECSSKHHFIDTYSQGIQV